MNANLYLRLMWKEYRAARMFWLALAVLIVLLQLLIVATSRESLERLSQVYSLTLIAPALFALGCAGSTFAVEREDGTFEFLRAAPVKSLDIVVSKLSTAVLLTIAMTGTMWSVTLVITDGRMPSSIDLHQLVGLWIMAAAEAIAWGMLFSLLTARPIVAICMAMACGSTVTHLLAWSCAATQNHFELASYDRAVPWRAVIVLVLLVIDICLGLRWLHNKPIAWKRAKEETRPATGFADERAHAVSIATIPVTTPDRSALYSHLFWQHWRQSRGLMLLMAVGGPLVLLPSISVLISYLDRTRWQYSSIDTLAITPFLILITLVGCCVFLPDQERRNYRFFLEHNVPPQGVWVTRQLPWLILMIVITALWCAVWISEHYGMSAFWKIVDRATKPFDSRQFDSYVPPLTLPPLEWAVGCAAASYAAGQWASMHIRSGIMAAFCALLLTGILCSWISLMDRMQVNFLWSVLPIPLVLLGATWFRAPDWLREDRRLSVRLKAATFLLAPAITLTIAVPIYRVWQIPQFSPGFDLQAFLSQVPQDGLTTAELYRKASILDEEEPRDPKDADRYINFIDESRPPSAAALKWLHGNIRSLDLVLEATNRPHCVFVDPRGDDSFIYLQHAHLVTLLLLNGRELEAQGKLDEALARYFAALKCGAQLSRADYPSDFAEVLHEITLWAAQNGQTPLRIRGAIEQLRKLDGVALRLEEQIKTEYAVALHQLQTNKFDWWLWRGHQYYPGSDNRDLSWITAMPWERARANRLLNFITQIALRRLEEMRSILDQTSSQSGIATFISPFMISPYDYVSTRFIYQYWMWAWPAWPTAIDRQLQKEVDWLLTTWPRPDAIGERGVRAAGSLAWHETARRATMIVLALELYRLEHNKLPDSLDQLAGFDLSIVPNDPYSGRSFFYYPSGIPKPNSFDALAEVKGNGYTQYIDFGQPCLWSIGPELEIVERNDESTVGKQLQFKLRKNQEYLTSDYSALARGCWFVIPDKK